jgi:50S ribosomal protein L16 3-hydroxylase
MPAANSLLGGLSPKAFLGGYWQKRPLLVRQAIPGFKGVIGQRELFDLAGSDATESRLIQKSRGWHVTQGPFTRREFSLLPKAGWTLLVNGLNLHSYAAEALLARFAFASWARLDDVMVSHAVDRGGVGAHVDSYDVFLLQGQGLRRWRLMPPGRAAFRLVKGAPLRLIANFRPTEEMTLEAGDMLYVPPGWAHEGVALGACQTYSIGFRAPNASELSTAFLDYLHERGFAAMDYGDAGRKPAAHPGEIDPHLVRHAARVLDRIRWDADDVADFVGRYLSEPRQHVVFDPPRHPLSLAGFAGRLATCTLRLDLRTRMLSHRGRIFLNGEALRVQAIARDSLQELADRRQIDGARLLRQPVLDMVFAWYREGFVTLGKRR